MKKQRSVGPASSPSTFEVPLIGSFLAVLAFWIGFFKIANTDIWWHLEAGELFLSQGLIRHDLFSFSAAGSHWVIHEWLAEVILFLIYEACGIVGLMLFKGVISAAIALLIFRFGVQRQRNIYLAASLAILTVAGMSFMMYARPHSLSFLFLAIELTILFGDFADFGKNHWARWIYLPALFLLWANIHGGFILGIGIYWIVAFYHFLRRGESSLSPKSKAKIFLLPALFAGVVCLINPNFHEIYTYIFVIIGNPLFKQTITEWVSPIYLGKEEWLAISILVLTSLLGLIVSFLALRRRPDTSLIVVATGVSAWMARRNIQNFAIVISIACLALPPLKVKLRRRSFKVLKDYTFVPALAFIAGLSFLVHDYQKKNGRTGIGILGNIGPLEAAAFLEENGFEGNLLNLLGDGGYLIWKGWPRWKVFIDGRLDVYGQDFVNKYRRIVEGAPEAMTAIERYGIDGAVLPFPPMIGNIRARLAADPQWALVHFDDNYLVFIKKNGKNAAMAERFAFKYINPLRAGFGVDNPALADSFMAEVERNLRDNPGSALANLIMAVASQYINDHENAAEHFKRAIEIKPALSNYSGNVAQAYFQAGNLDSARVWYEKAIAIRPTARAYYELGVIMWRKGDRAAANRYFRESIALDPSGPAAGMLEIK